jgi:hypothetical protein
MKAGWESLFINREESGVAKAQLEVDAGGRICRRFFEGFVLSQRAQSAPQRRGTEVWGGPSG